jgi:hypothetical protein
MTYQADGLAKGRTGRQPLQDMDYTVERFHDFAIVSPKFTEGPCSLLKNSSDRLDRIASFKLLGKWVFNKDRPCLLLIISQGNLEKGMKGGAGRIIHRGIGLTWREWAMGKVRWPRHRYRY